MDSNFSKIILVLAVILVVSYFFYKSSGKNEQAEQNLKAGKAFLLNNKNHDNTVETASGLQYQITEKGSGGESPTATDTVLVHYHGTLIDGTVFDSSVERGEPISFRLNQVISGWTEGLQLMSIGDTYTFFIPPQLAYGNRSAGKIGPQSTLVFEVELLDVNP